MTGSEAAALRGAWVLIAGLTLWRIVALWFNGTDLFVDEAQYWAWGQHLDWGYFSKPPLIGWVIRAVTDIAGSDTPFFVRLAAPLFHGAAALAVIWAARAFVDGWVAAWAGALYVAMPLVTVGSSLISTDTIMLPFFALALGAYGRLTEGPSLGRAVLLGVAVGLGLMAKYAMAYFVLCGVLVWIVQPSQRISLRDAFVASLIALAVFAPNIWWNIENDAQTLRHVVDDNAQLGQVSLNPLGALQFLAEQALAFGPILLGAVIWIALRRPRGAELTLLLFCLPIILLVTGQAFMSRAYGNWAATAYVAGPILAASALQMRRGLLVLSQVLNVGIALGLGLLLIFPTAIRDASVKPLLNRYLGLDEVSLAAAELARRADLTTLTSRDRSVLADLLYTLDGDELAVRAWRDPDDKVRHWYGATFPVERPLSAPVGFLDKRKPPCEGAELVGPVDPGFGAWSDRGLKLWKLPVGC